MNGLDPKPFRNLGLAVLAVFAMGMGIGSFSAVFAVARGLTRDLPVPEPGRLVQVARVSLRFPDDWNNIRSTHLREVRRAVTGLEDVGGFRTSRMHLTGTEGPPVGVRGGEIASGVLRVLRVDPSLGRPCEPADEETGAAPVVLLGHGLWQRRFGGDEDVVGRSIDVDDTRLTVIGVMPPGFMFPVEEELWTCLQLPPEEADVPLGPFASMRSVARLTEGSTPASLNAQLESLSAMLKESGRVGLAEGTLTVRPWTELMYDSGVVRAMPGILAIGFLILIVACANVASLLLVSALRGHRATAVRLALGAPRRLLMLERLLETLVLALLGGVLGVGVALAGVGAVDSAFEGAMSGYWEDFRVDGVVLMIAALSVILAAIMAGLLPALRGTEFDVGQTLRDTSAGSASMRLGRTIKLLVLAEVALSCTLLVSIGLLVQGVRGALLDDPPFAPEQIVVARYDILPSRYPDVGSRTAMQRSIHRGLVGAPGVEAVALADALPGGVEALDAVGRSFSIQGSDLYDVEGAGRGAPAKRMLISPDFLSLLGSEVVRGRDLSWEDAEGTELVVLVNRTFADRFLPGEDLLGRRLAFDPNRWWTVVGIAPDIGIGRSDEPEAPTVFVPVTQQPSFGSLWVMLRTPGDPSALGPRIREAIWAEDPLAPVYDVDRLDRLLWEGTRESRTVLTVFLSGVGTAFLLTVLGLHAVMAFAVGRRTREIAVRSALGASRAALSWLVLRTVAAQVSFGLVLGLPIAW